ncbi:MAG: glutathione S-transferase [Sandaracinaceae bacterium]|nr:glutathione S-transferase [Myxococcales bacterium]MCA9574892.1 glutathione S-transferase [Myxococcales bacterium]MCB9660176.1 glutathione S-transferase [Sandaracinaceae bacterium]
MSQLTLVGLSYSPWTERARWALAHHGIAYRYREHVPMVGEPALRLRARAPRGERVSVPLLVHPGGVVRDSVEIMRFADAHGGGPSLGASAPDTERWASRVEVGLAATRARVTAAILADPEALRESVLPLAPGPLAHLMKPAGALGARFVARKYGADLGDGARHEATLRAVLTDLRGALSGREHLRGDAFSACDILAATLLQGVAPVSHPRVRLLPAQRAAWTHVGLADEFADLVGWRDRLYAASDAAARVRIAPAEGSVSAPRAPA